MFLYFLYLFPYSSWKFDDLYFLYRVCFFPDRFNNRWWNPGVLRTILFPRNIMFYVRCMVITHFHKHIIKNSISYINIFVSVHMCPINFSKIFMKWLNNKWLVRSGKLSSREQSYSYSYFQIWQRSRGTLDTPLTLSPDTAEPEGNFAAKTPSPGGEINQEAAHANRIRKPNTREPRPHVTRGLIFDNQFAQLDPKIPVGGDSKITKQHGKTSRKISGPYKSYGGGTHPKLNLPAKKHKNKTSNKPPEGHNKTKGTTRRDRCTTSKKGDHGSP